MDVAPPRITKCKPKDSFAALLISLLTNDSSEAIVSPLGNGVNVENVPSMSSPATNGFHGHCASPQLNGFVVPVPLAAHVLEESADIVFGPTTTDNPTSMYHFQSNNL